MSTASGLPSRKLTWVKKMNARIKPLSSLQDSSQQDGKRGASKPNSSK